jgi:hypothetical protein
MTNGYCDLLPPSESLPPDIQELLGDHDGYDFFRVMPLIVAMDKPGGLTRKGFYLRRENIAKLQWIPRGSMR